jgi:hypothetical protein
MDGDEENSPAASGRIHSILIYDNIDESEIVL